MDAELIRYLAGWMPDAPIQCAGCTRQTAIGSAIEAERKFFCSERCRERELAPLIKPQPKGLCVDGWDV